MIQQVGKKMQICQLLRQSHKKLADLSKTYFDYNGLIIN